MNNVYLRSKGIAFSFRKTAPDAVEYVVIGRGTILESGDITGEEIDIYEAAGYILYCFGETIKEIIRITESAFNRLLDGMIDEINM